MKEIVFDIETYGNIKDQANMKVTVVSVYHYETDTYRSFDETQLGDMWPLFEKADRIIGFNSEHFDIPILNKYYTGDLFRFAHLDLLKVIKDSTGRRYKLDDLAKATLQMQKSADGLQAMQWYEAGEIEKIKQYCEQDVRVTKELYEFGRKNKMIYYPTLTGDIIPIAVDFDPPVRHINTPDTGRSINLTLPL